MRSVDRLGIFERLKHAIQLLACPPEIQLKMLPHFVCKADELGLGFDRWKEIVLNNFRSEMSTDQLSSMENIDRSLADLMQMGPEYWTQDAVRESARSGSVFAHSLLSPSRPSVGRRRYPRATQASTWAESSC
jgi:hypothetical protein